MVSGNLFITEYVNHAGIWKPLQQRKVLLAYAQPGTTPDFVHLGGTVIESPYKEELTTELRLNEKCSGHYVELRSAAARLQIVGTIEDCGHQKTAVAVQKKSVKPRPSSIMSTDSVH